MKPAILVTWVVLVHMVAGYLLYHNHDNFAWSGGESDVSGNKPSPHYRFLIRAHATIDPFVGERAVVFVGDSITEGLNTAAVTANSVNYGISNDTTEGVLRRLGKYASLQNAALVVLAIGVNDLVFRPVEDTAADYSRILEAIPANTPVLISALMPVDETAGWDGLNAKISDLNRRLPTLAGKRPNTALLDVSDRFRDDEGNLKRSLHNDGVHLNKSGYRIWIEALTAVISEMQVTD